MILLSLFFALFIVAGTKGQFSDDTNDDTALPKAPLNIVTSCYSSVKITKGLCATDEDCADDSERCYTQVCVAKHTVEKTAYRQGTIDTIIEQWPPLNKFNKMPLMDICAPEHTAGCYITRYIDWPPGTNTHLRTTDNAGFRGGCSDGYYEMDRGIRLPIGCIVHQDGTRTISCFCIDEDDCNRQWTGKYLEQPELVMVEVTVNITNTTGGGGDALLPSIHHQASLLLCLAAAVHFMYW